MPPAPQGPAGRAGTREPSSTLRLPRQAGPNPAAPCQAVPRRAGSAGLCQAVPCRWCRAVPCRAVLAMPRGASGAVPCCAMPAMPRGAGGAVPCRPCHAVPVVPGSEGHAGAVVPQLAGQDAAVDLVELHELDEVGEAGLPVVHGEVEPSLLLALPGGVGGSGPRTPSTPWHPPAPPGTRQRPAAGTHRQDEIVFDSLQVAQGQDEAFGVALALPHQEDAASPGGVSPLTLGPLCHPCVTPGVPGTTPPPKPWGSVPPGALYPLGAPGACRAPLSPSLPYPWGLQTPCKPWGVSTPLGSHVPLASLPPSPRGPASPHEPQGPITPGVTYPPGVPCTPQGSHVPPHEPQGPQPLWGPRTRPPSPDGR